MPLSVIDPIQPAIDHTQRVLFSPFDFGKWLKLGFCSFLVMLGQGGSGNVNQDFSGGPGGGPGGGPDFEPIKEWIEENAVLLAAIVVGVFLILLALGLLLTWLSSRGHFMFLDGVVRNRGAVVAPWREYRREGNSLFVFRFLLGIAGFLVIILLVAVCVMIAWQDIQAEQFGDMAMLAAVLGFSGLFAFVIVMALVQLFLKDFVVPIMYLRRIRTMEAWSVFSSEMLAGNLGTFILYVLIKILMAIALAILAMVLFCATCCIAVIPYVGSVVMLPISVFERSFSLYFIEQFGPEWTIFPYRDEPLPPEPVA